MGNEITIRYLGHTAEIMPHKDSYRIVMSDAGPGSPKTSSSIPNAVQAIVRYFDKIEQMQTKTWCFYNTVIYIKYRNYNALVAQRYNSHSWYHIKVEPIINKPVQWSFKGEYRSLKNAIGTVFRLMND